MSEQITVRIIDAYGEGVLGEWRSSHAGYQAGDGLSLQQGAPELKVLRRRWDGPDVLELHTTPWR